MNFFIGSIRMTVTLLRITNFRNLAAVELSPGRQGFNLICGSNGSGKTSLLEAIYYLGLGRSFRTSTNTRLIRHSSDQFSLYAQLMSKSERVLSIGMQRHIQGASALRIDDNDVVSIAELASFLPILMLNHASPILLSIHPIPF